MADAEGAAVLKGDEKRRLVDIDVDEISLVDKGANRKTFLVIKNETGQGGIETMADDKETKKGEGAKDGVPSPTGGAPVKPEDVKKGAEPTPPETKKPDAPAVKADEKVEPKTKADPEKMAAGIKTAMEHLDAASKALAAAVGEYGSPSSEEEKQKRDGSPTLNDLVTGLTAEVKALGEKVTSVTKRDDSSKVEDIIKAAVDPLVDRLKKVEDNIVGASKGEAADGTDVPAAPVKKSDKKTDWTGVL